MTPTETLFGIELVGGPDDGAQIDATQLYPAWAAENRHVYYRTTWVAKNSRTLYVHDMLWEWWHSNRGAAGTRRPEV